MSDAWWQSFFDESYRENWAPVLGASRTEAELEALVALLPDPPGFIVDVAGGSGRVAIPLAQAGCPVVVVDYSRSMLEEGQARAREAGAKLCFVQADARSLPFVAGAMDAALNLFTSFGYFESEAEHLRMLAQISKVLAPGGTFVMDLVHRDFIATLAPERSWFELDSGERVVRFFDFDPISGRTIEWLERSGVRKTWSLQLFSATEIDRMTRRVGLEPREWYGGFDLEPFGARSPRLLLEARRLGAPQAQKRERMSMNDWRDLVGLVACPETGEGLALLEKEALEALNTRISEGDVRSRDGALVESAVDEGLVTPAGWVYPVRGDIPELLAERAILVAG